MTPEEVHEELLQLRKQVVTKEELQREFKQRESEAAIAESRKWMQRMHYGLVGLWGILIGGFLTMCASHYKP